MASLGIPKEDRAFSPHLTLARGAGSSGSPRWRKEDGPNPTFHHLQQKLSALPSPEFGTMTPRDFYLYQSQLSPKGSKYTKLAAFALKLTAEQPCPERSKRVPLAVAGASRPRDGRRQSNLQQLQCPYCSSWPLSVILGSIPFGYIARPHLSRRGRAAIRQRQHRRNQRLAPSFRLFPVVKTEFSFPVSLTERLSLGANL